MKKILYSLLTLAAALTVASCQQELVGGSAYDDGSTVDATFAVNLGVQTKAFADGTTVNELYAGIYEIGANNAYTWVADNSASPIAISAGAATVTFNGKIKLGKSYKVVFWAQKEGAPYAIDWAKTGTAGPTVTVTATGDANDESRDAFYGEYLTGEVTGNITVETKNAVQLKRPFAQVNVLVPNDNIAAYTTLSSEMKVYKAPNILNLATRATSGEETYSFTSKTIGEKAFDKYENTHKYVAMNYVLVKQGTEDQRYDVEFKVVTDAPQTTGETPKSVKNTPLKPNGRTNIVGNIFAADFDITVPVIVTPKPGSDQVLTTVTVNVGQTDADAVELTYNPTTPATTSIEVAVSHPVTEEADKPQITVEPASVATAEWNLTTGKLDVTPKVANGSAVITLVFPAVTKTDYSAATVQVYVKVGNGQNEELEQVAAPTFTPAAGEYTAAQSVEIACATEGAAIYYTTDGTDPTAASTAYTAAIAVGETMTIKAIAIKEGMTDSEVATAAYTINIPMAQVATPTFSVAAGTYTSAQSVSIACETDDASIYYTTDGTAPTTSSTPYTAAIAVSATTTIKAIAVKEGMENSEIAEATYTIDAESVVYSLSPVATGSNSSPHNSYTAAATTTISKIGWSVMGNSNMVPWRIGGKNISDENREIFSLNAISENVSKIVVTHGEASSITVNSVTLVVASDSSFETVVSEISKNDFAASSTMTFNRPDGKSWANCYYKFVYNVTVSGDKNKFLEFVGADFTGK